MKNQNQNIENIKKTMLEVIRAENDADTWRIFCHDVVLGVISSWEGKRVNKRIEAKIKEALDSALQEKTPGNSLASVYYAFSVSWYEVRIRVPGRDEVRLTLCYDSDPFIRVESFIRQNVACGDPARERIQKNLDFQCSPNFHELARAFALMQEARAIMDREELSGYDVPARYALNNVVMGE